MKHKWSIRFANGVTLLCGLLMTAVFPASLGADTAPRPYMRVGRTDAGAVTLEIAVRKFVNPARTSPAIWLVGVSHIGEMEYYQALQRMLDEQDLVLFEGVGYEAMQRESKLASRTAENKPRESSSLQSTMAEALGLEFQLDAIEYDRANFRNSDVSLEELQRLLTKRREGGKTVDSEEANPEFMALIQAMDGSSWMGKVLQFGFKFLGANPKLRELSRLMLVEMLGQMDGDLSQIQGLPPNLQEMLRVLIQSRNQVVLTDVKKALETEPKVATIAVFYGAAHMADFEKRLKDELGFLHEEEQWFPAVTVDPGKAGLSTAEVAMVRGMVGFQMNMLRQQGADGKE